MDAELVGVPGLATLTVGGLTGGDLESFGLERVSANVSGVFKPGVWTYGHADRSADGQVLGAGTVDELGADTLEGGDLAAGQSDADAVSLLQK